MLHGFDNLASNSDSGTAGDDSNLTVGCGGGRSISLLEEDEDDDELLFRLM